MSRSKFGGELQQSLIRVFLAATDFNFGWKRLVNQAADPDRCWRAGPGLNQERCRCCRRRQQCSSLDPRDVASASGAKADAGRPWTGDGDAVRGADVALAAERKFRVVLLFVAGRGWKIKFNLLAQ